MAITHFLNCKGRVQQFCYNYTPSSGSKPLSKDDILQSHYQKELEYLHDYLETFYKATLIVKGNSTGLANYFQTFNWLLNQLDSTKQKFLELSTKTQKVNCVESQSYKYLAGCLKAAQAKCEKYYKKANETAAYYTAIVLNPTLKMLWFEQ